MFKVYPDYGIYKNNFPMLKKKIYEDQKIITARIDCIIKYTIKGLSWRKRNKMYIF